jgi:hypothetical protein
MPQFDSINLPQGSINFNTAPAGIGRTSSNVNFASELKNAMGQGLAASSRGMSYVAPMVPGGAVLSAMLSSAANVALGGGNSPAVAGGAMGNMGAGGDFMSTMQNMQQNMQASSMQMIALQENSQRMNIEFSTKSNMMKVRHDTDKNSISNIRA